MLEKSHSNLSELTLVMPTCRRQDYVFRNLEYWSKTDVKIIILDDSPKSIDKEIINKLNKNITYIHSQKSYSDRLEIAANQINTKYAQLICDDEFYIISALNACIEELEKDVTIISCSGCCLKFNYKRKKNYIYSHIVYEPLTFEYNYTMIADPIDRMSKYMENYVPFLMYGVVRSNYWKKAFKIPSKKNFNFFAYEEIQINIFLSLAGKSKVLKQLLWLRSEENVPTRDNFIDKRQPQFLFETWWYQNEEEKKSLIQIMSKVFQEINLEIKTDFQTILNIAFKNYIKGGGGNLFKKKTYLTKKHKGIFVFCIITSVTFIKRILPNKIKKFFKSLGYFIKLQKNFYESAIDLNKRGVKVDINNLKMINQIVRKFHNIKDISSF